MHHRLELTDDGSHTIATDKETYHSRHGAIQESQHVFIEAGLMHLPPPLSDPIHILEVGFGTGLNALLSWQTNRRIHYVAIEPHPLPPRLWHALNYDTFVATGSIEALHACPWDQTTSLSETFTFHKQCARLEDALLTNHFDVIYFDAFSPNTQPELWTPSIFSMLFDYLTPTGRLVTYSSKGTVKRALKDAGFKIERLPGPPGKHHMIRATRLH